MEKKLINLTPHEICVYMDDGDILVIPPDETPARCVESSQKIYELNGVPVVIKKYGDVEGLPEKEPGHAYIVSIIVANAVRGTRGDVYITADLVRDASGRVVGCRSFAQVQ
ncbi:hypothetical protein [Synergistes jonesii]|uniref:Uncharacterized protein n=1 Tax=Synergistes jonesii TaxID=2754 RepID=A0A073J633_9BACT|nr:hypothetical protein [Synergistes jonesii]KEJ93182.1 hypothetical protein EH55_12835 [Synergistes jonesii]OFB60704.1 hypothetical protein JS72_12065 [Synergistes jonesii]OFB64799.1 hypothetical protein JS73_02820 [Synergistes jonesii]OFB66100.1 hypothetical protein JS79_02825 [Synergistes jonesii]OFB68959.1 hypothetical protein JS78_02825 [Synergistes jonesii]